MKHSRKTIVSVFAIIAFAGVAYTVFDIHRHGLFENNATAERDGKGAVGPAVAPIPCYANKRNSWRAAKDVVRRRLKSPTTAKFSPSPWKGEPDLETAALEQCSYFFRAYVDSQNAYGAMIRTHFTITIRRLSNGDWSVVEFKTDI